MKNIREYRVPLLVLIPGHERLIEAHGQDYSDIIGGLCDVFPTIIHLIGETIPYGLYGTHLFVANRDRDPMPTQYGYTYNEILYAGKSGRTIQENGKTLYTDDPETIVTNKRLLHRFYSQSVDVITLHQQFFMNRAQEILVEKHPRMDRNPQRLSKIKGVR